MMNPCETTVQIIISDKVCFDSINGTHSIEKIRNYMYVPIFPSVVITDVLIRLSNIPDNSINVDLKIKSVNNKVLFHKSILGVTNLRKEGMTPGIDIPFHVRFPVTTFGNYYYVFYINDEFIDQHTLYVGESPS